MKVGLDVGSTTIKCVVLDDADNLIYSTYERHYSHIVEKSEELLRRAAERYVPGGRADLAISGSAGMGMAESVGVPFVQEVFATRVAAGRLAPGTDCIIELGGEDAKILFLTGGMEVRMNGSCAGGTGAFIDQMATLLKMSADEMDAAAQRAEKTYTIASRCGVFAKSDVQPLINQGARAEDISASIYQAVVNQTIAGLAQGRPIKGNVLYLGGPLTFSRCLRESFDHTLGVQGTCPENSLLYVALGAAFYSDQAFDLIQVADDLQKRGAAETYRSQPPLFSSQEEYEAFRARHARAAVPRVPFGPDYAAPVHIGIDSGSTTVKVVVIDQEARILFTDYRPNLGNPVPLIRQVLQQLYDEHPALHVASVTTTGYGEDLAKNAFHADYGVVETVAHFTAARHFLPNVDFIIDIGGQDMKCFKIEDGAISNIFLNEACSSGCGSFLQTFAQALGYDVKEFAKLGLFADRPVDLGSRCTVFMNSSVKQAQKDGATIENISAGLSISVVKNAIYKVIRASSPEELGRNIVVQGGTLLQRGGAAGLEKEMGVEVIRPDIAGLMGAFGAALYGRGKAAPGQTSALLDREGLAGFRQETREPHLRPLRQQLPADHQHLRRQVHLHQRQPLRPARHRQGRHRGAKPLRLQAQADPGVQARPRKNGAGSASPLCPEHVGAAALLAHLLHEAGLRRVPQPPVQPGPVPEGPGHHPQRHRLLSGQAGPRPYPLPLEAGAGRHLLPLYDLQHRRGAGGQPLQLPRGGLLPGGHRRQLPGDQGDQIPL